MTRAANCVKGDFEGDFEGDFMGDFKGDFGHLEAEESEPCPVGACFQKPLSFLYFCFLIKYLLSSICKCDG